MDYYDLDPHTGEGKSMHSNKVRHINNVDTLFLALPIISSCVNINRSESREATRGAAIPHPLMHYGTMRSRLQMF
jgi:hypothetical protein